MVSNRTKKSAAKCFKKLHKQTPLNDPNTWSTKCSTIRWNFDACHMCDFLNVRPMVSTTVNDKEEKRM